jgi:hypothetical protein
MAGWECKKGVKKVQDGVKDADASLHYFSASAELFYLGTDKIGLYLIFIFYIWFVTVSKA